MEDLASRGFEIVVATPIPAGFKPPLDYVQQIEWRINKSSLNPLKEASALIDLVRILLKVKPHVVFAHTIKPIIYGLPLAAMTGVRTCCALIPGLGYVFGEENSLRRRITSWVARAGYRFALARANLVLLQNDDDMETLSNLRVLPRHASVIVVSGSGLDMSLYTREPLPLAPPFTFLFVARLLKEKGVSEFVDAARIVKGKSPECRFVVVGAPDTVPSAVPEAQLSAWKSENIVEFRGHVDDPRADYARCHVFVLPSYYREGCPRVNLEAMATGRAVITTNSVGCRDTVIHGTSGLLVPPRDHKALAEAMMTMVNNPDLVARMGEVGWEYCRKRFELGIVTEQISQGLLEAMS